MRVRNLIQGFGLMLLLSAIGCGGSTNVVPGGGDNAQFDGVYSAAYNRVGGTITVGVIGHTVSMTVDDDTAGFFSGSGGIHSDNTFGAVCTSETGATITVAGSLSGSGLSRQAAGHVGGTITFDYSATFNGWPQLSAYANHYTGNSDTQGPFHLDVAPDGTASGMFGNFNLFGTVTRTGYLNAQLFNGTEPTGVFVGQLRLGEGHVSASGRWQFSTLHGRWSGTSGAG